MAAVIGSRDNYNRDPKKMGRFWNAGSGGGIVIPSVNTGITQLSSTGFATTNIWTTVTTASAIVAGQSYTIYNVSGASGFLIHAWTNCTNANSSDGANTVTYTVTVDGVASTVSVGQAGTASSYMAGWLGQVAGGRMDQDNFRPHYTNQNGQVGGTEFPRGAMYSIGNSIASPINVGNKVMDYSSGNSSIQGMLYAQNLDAPIFNPMSCTRFENSLTVAYTTTVPIANSVAASRRTYGALIKLDD